jgi:hypothetical protein
MRSGRFLQRLHKRPDKRRSPNWPRTIAWQNARRVQLQKCRLCSVPGCHAPGPLEAHDVVPYAELNPAQRSSFEFLLGNLRTLCRQHHELQHPHLQR